MRALFLVLGVILLIAGVAGLIHPRWASPSHKKEVDFENHKIIYETTRYIEIPKAWGAVAVFVGGAMIFVGARKV